MILPMTLRRGMAVYLQDCYARGEADTTIAAKQSNVRSFVTWCALEKLTYCTEVDLPALELYRAYIRDYIYPQWRRKLDISTQRNRLTAVRMFLRRLHYHKLIPTNPGEFFELPSVPRRIPRTVLTVDEIECILEHVLLYGLVGIRDRAILEMFYATALRRMELGRLEIF